MKRVVMDADGVLLDFHSTWEACAEDVLGRPIHTLNNQYHSVLRYGITEEERNRVWRAFHARGLVRDIKPYPEAASVVAAIQDMGAKVLILTALDDAFHGHRAESLEGIVAHEDIICCGSEGDGRRPSTQVKAEHLKRLSPLAYIDDRPDIANAALPHVPYVAVHNLGYLGLGDAHPDVHVLNRLTDFIQVCRLAMPAPRRVASLRM